MRLPRSIALLAATACFSTVTFVAPAMAAEEATVEISLIEGVSPSDLVVETGTTVTWTNAEAVPALTTGPTGTVAITHHLVSSDGSFDTGALLPGQLFSETFNEPLEISYSCDIHPNLLSGTFTVEGEPFVPPATEQTVKIVEPKSNDSSTWGYEPKDLSVTTGTTITWRNEGGLVHTVTAEDGSFDSGDLEQGETFVMTFGEPVAITYKCEPHPWMTGTLVVAAPGEDPPVIPKPKPTAKDSGGGSNQTPVVTQPDRVGNEPATFQAQIVEGSVSDPNSWGYAPESLTVRAGDTVVWTNTGAIDHTVTSTTFDSGMIGAGGTFSYTFASLGTISFSCTPHPWMTGAIAVIAADASDADLDVAPEVPEPTVALPGSGGSTGGTDGGDAGGDVSGEADHGSSASEAWSLGHVPLAAGTGAGLLGVGLLFLAPLASELRRAKAEPATPKGVPERGPGGDPELTVDPDVIDLTEEFEVEQPVLVGAGAPLPSTPKAAARKPAANKTSARKPAAKKATARKPAEKATARKPAERKPAAKRVTRSSMSGSRSSKD